MEVLRLALMRAVAASLTARLQWYCISASASSTAVSTTIVAGQKRRFLNGNFTAPLVAIKKRQAHSAAPALVHCSRLLRARMTHHHHRSFMEEEVVMSELLQLVPLIRIEYLI